MLYAFIGEDAPGSLEIRRTVRPQHLARIETLREQGRLILAGPLPAIDSSDPGPAGFLGSLIVAEFPSISDAEQWFAEDPYVKHGVFIKTIVHPFLKVLP